MPDSETNFWHRQYRFEPYFVAGRSFDQYCQPINWDGSWLNPLKEAASISMRWTES